MEDTIAVLLATIISAIILVYLALLAMRQAPAARVPLMSVPVEESLDQIGNYPSELVVSGHQRPNVPVAPCQNSYLRDTIHSLLLLSILLWYVALYLLVCNGHMGEDDPVQEPVQCTNTGNAVTVVRGKDYPPPAD